jgi:geranylgeranyl pyrophosphate synthase
MSNKEVLSIFTDFVPEIESEIKKLIDDRPHLLMYDMMRYFFGFLNEDLTPAKMYGGKRYRPGLCMMLAQMYGKCDMAIEAAAAIEIFHNFTLIHDDIEDNDEIRRGRPTVWKLWGLNHGINSGDGQNILVNIELAKLAKKEPVLGAEVLAFLSDCFLQVVEGQFLDFTLTDLSMDDEFVTRENYMEMITKKTSVLVAAATKVAGIVSGVSDDEKEKLWQYGLNLGLAFQMQDDWNSIWANDEETGKRKSGDIYEQKKTLPVLYAYEELEGDKKDRLVSLYKKNGGLDDQEVKEVIELLNGIGAKEYFEKVIVDYGNSAKDVVESLSVSDESKETLKEVVKALIK